MDGVMSEGQNVDIKAGAVNYVTPPDPEEARQRAAEDEQEICCTEIPDFRAKAQEKRDILAKEAKAYEQGVAQLEVILRQHKDALIATNGAVVALDQLLAP